MTEQSFAAYFDGACGPHNPGGTASFGAVIFENGEPVWKCSEIYVPEQGHERDTSNNIAEYAGFNAVLEWFADQNLFDADIIKCLAIGRSRRASVCQWPTRLVSWSPNSRTSEVNGFHVRKTALLTSYPRMRLSVLVSG
jgi:hypothetical protein